MRELAVGLDLAEGPDETGWTIHLSMETYFIDEHILEILQEKSEILDDLKFVRAIDLDSTDYEVLK